METKDVTGRCAGCKFLKIMSDGRWQFPSCTHEPYKGKWTREIEHCPKNKEVANEND